MAAYTLTAPHARLVHQVFDVMEECGPIPFGIYSFLVRVQNRTNGACFPSLKTIAKKCHLDKKTVIKYLRLLELKGIIVRKARYKANGRRTSNQYDLTRFWEMAKKVVVDAFTAGQEPPIVPVVDPTVPSLEEAVASAPSPAMVASVARQEECGHPGYLRRQPTTEYAFCGHCFAEIPVLIE